MKTGEEGFGEKMGGRSALVLGCRGGEKSVDNHAARQGTNW